MDIKLLDCTLRDGGYVNNWNFSDTYVRDCYLACSNSGVEYMELGFRNFRKPDLIQKYGPTYFCEESYINNVIGDIKGCKIAVMVTINAFDINDFVPKNKSKIDLVRVLMAYHGSKNGCDEKLDIKQLDDGFKQINQLIDLGYDVSFNIGRIDKLSKNLLYELCKRLSETKIKYFIMADTYGTVDLHYIDFLIPYIKFLFRDVFENKDIKIGFHAHDNCSDATSKALYSLKYGVDMIDGCMMGFGRGSGNAKTELLMLYLNKNYKQNYDFLSIMEFENKYISSYVGKGTLSYNIIYAITAHLGCHVSYAIDIIEKYPELDIRKVYNTFLKLTDMGKNMFYYEKLFMEVYNSL